MAQFSGNLINGKSAYLWLFENLKGLNANISLCSAFLRSSVIDDLSKNFHRDATVRVMVRWKLSDLLAGASDLQSYRICSKLGWKFFVSLNFHGKVFHLPSHGILVGSANATESGFGLLSNSNSEACTIVPDNDSNSEFVNQLFFDSVEMTDELFESLQLLFDQALNDNSLPEWPSHILEVLTKPVVLSNKLFISECFITDGNELLSFPSQLSVDANSDLSLLGHSNLNSNLDSVAKQFSQTKLFKLTLNLLEERGGEVYFGALTEALHDWLVEDPAPYRSEVKILVKNLYCWIALLGSEKTGLIVDKPRHSERIRKI
jgi:hypothetical protein